MLTSFLQPLTNMWTSQLGKWKRRHLSHSLSLTNSDMTQVKRLCSAKRLIMTGSATRLSCCRVEAPIERHLESSALWGRDVETVLHTSTASTWTPVDVQLSESNVATARDSQLSVLCSPQSGRTAPGDSAAQWDAAQYQGRRIFFFVCQGYFTPRTIKMQHKHCWKHKAIAEKKIQP